MPEVSNKAVRPVSSGKKDTGNKPKLNGTKQKIQTAEPKGKELEKGTTSGWQKPRILSKDKNKNLNSKDKTNETEPTQADYKQNSQPPSIELKPKTTVTEQNQNGKIPGISKTSVAATKIESTKELNEEPRKEPKKVTKKDSEKKVLLPKQLSVENGNQPETTIDVSGHSTQAPNPLEKQRTFVTNNDSWIMSNIPYLPLGLAVVYLILNIVIPGLGLYHIISDFQFLELIQLSLCFKLRLMEMFPVYNIQFTINKKGFQFEYISFL